MWGEAIAQSIAEHLNKRHHDYFYRQWATSFNSSAFRIVSMHSTGASFRTIMPIVAGAEVDFEAADYLWVTSP